MPLLEKKSCMCVKMFNCSEPKPPCVSWLEVRMSARTGSVTSPHMKAPLVVKLNHSWASGDVAPCSNLGSVPGPPHCLSACEPGTAETVGVETEQGNPIRYHSFHCEGCTVHNKHWLTDRGATSYLTDNHCGTWTWKQWPANTLGSIMTKRRMQPPDAEVLLQISQHSEL